MEKDLYKVDNDYVEANVRMLPNIPMAEF